MYTKKYTCNPKITCSHLKWRVMSVKNINVQLSPLPLINLTAGLVKHPGDLINDSH